MMSMQRRDIEPVVRWTDRQFGDWILRGLIGFHVHQQGRHAFQPLEAVFAVDYSVTADFTALYSLLGTVDRASFRSGLAIALAKVPMDAVHREVVSDILELARECKADEVLSVLASRLRAEHEAIAGMADGMAFMRWTIHALAKFAGPSSSLTQDGYAAAQALLDALSGEDAVHLFLLLAQLSPGSLEASLSGSWSKLDAVFASVEDNADDLARQEGADRMVESLARFVSLDQLGGTLSKDTPTYDVTWWDFAVHKLLATKGWHPSPAETPKASTVKPIRTAPPKSSLNGWQEAFESLFSGSRGPL